jgi:hypothetical protein
MSKEHKAALAQGRRESRAIKAYLKALDSRRPGRPVTPETLTQRMAALDEKIAREEDPLKRVELRQQRLDAEQALAGLEQQADLKGLEEGFIKYARSYSDRKGISYTAWRKSGVPASVLREAGIARTRS